MIQAAGAQRQQSLIPSLTGLRAVAAGLVFFYHWFFDNAQFLPLALRAPFDVGYVGVPMFFALSGFLITERYYDEFVHKRIGYGAYLWKRFARIYPLYLFVITFLVMVPGRPENLVPKGFWAVLSAYTLTQALSPEFIFVGTMVAWTLTLEALFYLLAPWLMLWIGRARSAPGVVVLTAVAAAASVLAALLIGQIPRPDWAAFPWIGTPQAFWMHYSLLGHLPDFLVGIAAGLIYTRGKATRRSPRLARGLIWLGVLGAYACIIGLDTVGTEIGSVLNRALGAGVALGTVLVILGTAYDTLRASLVTRLLGSRPVVYLGKISYALYLIQLTEPCQWIYWVLIGVHLGIEDRILRALLLCGFTIVMAAILYELVERPAQKLLNQWFAWARTRAAARQYPSAIAGE